MAQIRSTYVPRWYSSRYGQQQQGGGFQQGWKIGQEAGQQIGQLIGLPAHIKAQQGMDAAANALMNRVDPQTQQPTDESGNAVDPNDIDADQYDWGETPAHSGGYAELQSMIDMRKAEASLSGQESLSDQLKRAQIAHLLNPPALTPAQQFNIDWKEKQEQRRQQEATQKLEQKAVETARQQQLKNVDTPQKVLKDFNAVYPGKDPKTDQSYGEVYFNALQQGSGARGDIGPDGKFVGNPNGQYFTYQSHPHGMPADQVHKIPLADLQKFADRIDALKASPSQRVLPAPMAQPVGSAGTTPDTSGIDTTEATSPATSTDTGTDMDTSGQDLSQANLPQPATLAHYNAIPHGSLFIDGDGLTKRKLVA
jgi:hypothetical protein